MVAEEIACLVDVAHVLVKHGLVEPEKAIVEKIAGLVDRLLHPVRTGEHGRRGKDLRDGPLLVVVPRVVVMHEFVEDEEVIVDRIAA